MYLNCPKLISGCHSSGGRSFQILGPTTEMSLSPKLLCVCIMFCVLCEQDSTWHSSLSRHCKRQFQREDHSLRQSSVSPCFTIWSTSSIRNRSTFSFMTRRTRSYARLASRYVTPHCRPTDAVSCITSCAVRGRFCFNGVCLCVACSVSVCQSVSLSVRAKTEKLLMRYLWCDISRSPSWHLYCMKTKTPPMVYLTLVLTNLIES